MIGIEIGVLRSPCLKKRIAAESSSYQKGTKFFEECRRHMDEHDTTHAMGCNTGKDQTTMAMSRKQKASRMD
ncbi:MAG TPA: hypothetical protein VI251_06365 [Pseudolabrys sp.]|jgi:hypothetical protein